MTKNTSEFSRILDVNAVGNAIKEHKLAAKPDERKALASRLDVLEIELFEVIYTVKQIPNKSFKVEGKIKAKITQTCVSTMEPVKKKVTSQFGLFLRPENPNSVNEDDLDLSVLSTELEEEIDIPATGKIDMGEVFTQYLALDINPYPRKEGVESTHKEFEENSEKNPFDVLKKLK